MTKCGTSEGFVNYDLEVTNPAAIMASEDPTGESDPDVSRDEYKTCAECWQQTLNDEGICDELCNFTDECCVTKLEITSSVYRSCQSGVEVTYDARINKDAIVEDESEETDSDEEDTDSEDTTDTVTKHVRLYVVVRNMGTDADNPSIVWSAPDIAVLEVNSDQTWYRGNEWNIILPESVTPDEILEVSIYAEIPDADPYAAGLDSDDAEFFAAKWPGPGFDMPA